MKAMLLKTFLLVSLLPALGIQDACGQTFWLDSFETTTPTLGIGGTRAVSGGHANSTDGTFCLSGDYFFRTTTTGVDAGMGLTAIFTGFDLATIWRAEDLDACIVNPDTITWTGIDIAGRTNLLVGGRFAARDTMPFETGDSILLEWQIDGGGFATGLMFSATAATNAHLALNGTTPLLTNTLTDFMFSPGSTGNTLDLRLTVSVNAGSEEIALDLFQVAETAFPVELQGFKVE